MKKILIFGPALPQWNEMRSIQTTYQFLNEEFQIDCVDPLQNSIHNLDQNTFFSYWKNQIEILASKYDIFFGMSLGGVILQQCFDIFKHKNKPIVLFSVPSFSDAKLFHSLTRVIDLIQNQSIFSGIEYLNNAVFYPYTSPINNIELEDPKNAALRLSYGLQIVCNTDSRPILQQSRVHYLHLIGEQSKLVNRDNVITPSSAQLLIVPQAGMRVLQNNLEFCIRPIKTFLENNPVSEII